MIDGWRLDDPETKKKLPVEADVPEFMAEVGRSESATELDTAVGDLGLIAFYYLLRVGEYTKKSSRTGTKRTVQFRLSDVAFFKNDARGLLRLLPPEASDEDILSANGATLKIENQKNGWKNVCVHQQSNGDKYLCPVRALSRRFIHIRRNTSNPSTELSAYWSKGGRADVTDKDIRASIKSAVAILDYPSQRGISVQDVDTHSLRCGGANALALAGYSETQIQKMGRWRGDTFKEYMREQLACYYVGMSKAMKQKFNFVNIAHGGMRDVTTNTVASPYVTAPAA